MIPTYKFNAIFTCTGTCGKLDPPYCLVRAYIAQGEHDIVLDEVKDDSAVPLQAVRLLATYLSKPENQDLVMVATSKVRLLCSSPNNRKP